MKYDTLFELSLIRNVLFLVELQFTRQQCKICRILCPVINVMRQLHMVLGQAISKLMDKLKARQFLEKEPEEEMWF